MYKIFLSTLLVMSILACDTRDEEKQFILRAGVLPDQNITLLMQKYQPLINHLSQKLSMPVKLVIPKDYSHLLNLFVKGEVDSAFLGRVGLGLNIVSKLTELIGAKFSFDCQENIGTIASFTFPKKMVIN